MSPSFAPAFSLVPSSATTPNRLSDLDARNLIRDNSLLTVREQRVGVTRATRERDGYDGLRLGCPLRDQARKNLLSEGERKNTVICYWISVRQPWRKQMFRFYDGPSASNCSIVFCRYYFFYFVWHFYFRHSNCHKIPFTLPYLLLPQKIYECTYDDDESRRRNAIRRMTAFSCACICRLRH